MTIAILATGDELIHGDTLNTTSQKIATSLSQAGFSMGAHLCCGDKHDELVSGIQYLYAHFDALILTGGLGPTSDDRTRFALADVLKIDLVEFESAKEHIEQRLRKHSLLDDYGQRQQALFPSQGTLFPNPNGTALGCGFVHHQKSFVMLPGPPAECMPMFEEYALPYLKSHSVTSEKVCLKWRLIHVPEGPIAFKLEDLLKDIPCVVGYRLDKPYLEVKVRCKREQQGKVREVVEPLLKPHIADEPHV